MENKSFKTYLKEQSFYFLTINDPDLTIYGQKVYKSEDEKLIDKKNKDKKLKDPATDSLVKLSTFLKIAQSIQEQKNA